MKKEFQIASNERLNLQSDFMGIVLGDEGCVYRSLDSRWMEIAEESIRSGLTVRYLTPIVPDQYVDELYEYINKMTINSNIKVTFNDFGLLSKCRSLIEKKKITPVLGRILSRSVCECPWYKELLKYEDPELAAVLITNTFNHQIKKDILKEFNIKEIELNQQDLTFFNGADKEELKFTTYLPNRIVAVGRICYSARWYEMVLPDCREDIRCRNKLDIQLNMMWGKKRLLYEKPPENMKNYYKNLYVMGNIVYEQLSTDDLLDSLKGFDTVIN